MASTRVPGLPATPTSNTILLDDRRFHNLLPDEEWGRLVEVMGAPSWATDPKFATVTGRLDHQQELDDGIEAWTMTLGKYEVTELCQAAGVRALPVQSAEDRVEHDPQLRHREMFLPVEHTALGDYKVQNAPFKLSETPAANTLPSSCAGIT